MKKKPATKKLYSDPIEKKVVAKKALQTKKSSEEKKKEPWEISSEDETGDFKPLKSKKQPAKK